MSLPSFCDCADRFESTLADNPKDRFSRDKAHMYLAFVLKPYSEPQIQQPRKTVTIKISESFITLVSDTCDQHL